MTSTSTLTTGIHILRSTEWSPQQGTVIEGRTTWIRVLVLNYCSGCNFTEAHAIETKGEGAQCWNCHRTVPNHLIHQHNAEVTPTTVPVIERTTLQGIVDKAFPGAGYAVLQGPAHVLITPGNRPEDHIAQLRTAITSTLGDDPRTTKLADRVSIEDGYLVLHNVAMSEPNPDEDDTPMTDSPIRLTETMDYTHLHYLVRHGWAYRTETSMHKCLTRAYTGHTAQVTSGTLEGLRFTVTGFDNRGFVGHWVTGLDEVGEVVTFPIGDMVLLEG